MDNMIYVIEFSTAADGRTASQRWPVEDFFSAVAAERKCSRMNCFKVEKCPMLV